MRCFIQVARIQRSHVNLLTTTFDCLSGAAESSAPIREVRDRSLSLLLGLAAPTEPVVRGEARIVLITQYFHSSDETVRAALVDTLARNLADPAIEQVALINEKEYDFSALQNSHKIKQFINGRRLTFSDAFRVANGYFTGYNVVLCNSDIYFDNTLNMLTSASLNGSVLALSKWTSIGADDAISLSLRLDSQDAWVFRSPINQAVVENSDFVLGAPKCDNRLARIVSDGGYRLVS